MEMKIKMRLAGPDELQSEMERYFAHLGRWKRPVFFFGKAWKPLCDVSETDSEVVVVADLSGVEPANINIRVEGNNLIMHGVRREPVSALGTNFLQMEISYGPFERVIGLPCPVEAERASATYDEGFLEIRLPKTGKQPSRKVDIDASS